VSGGITPRTRAHHARRTRCTSLAADVNVLVWTDPTLHAGGVYSRARLAARRDARARHQHERHRCCCFARPSTHSVSVSVVALSWLTTDNCCSVASRRRRWERERGARTCASVTLPHRSLSKSAKNSLTRMRFLYTRSLICLSTRSGRGDERSRGGGGEGEGKGVSICTFGRARAKHEKPETEAKAQMRNPRYPVHPRHPGNGR